MPLTYRSPGVYQEEVFLQPQTQLLTGIPAFLGWFTANQLKELPPENLPILLNRREEFTDKFSGLPSGYLSDAITGFFENGGTRCYIVRVMSTRDQEATLKAAIAALATLSDVDLVSIPDLMVLSRKEAIYRVQQALIDHCTQQGDRLAVLDALPGSSVSEVLLQRQTITLNRTEPIDATLYYPWLKNAQGKWVPPCGHIAGMMAKSDRTSGVFKAPANVPLQDVLDLKVAIDNSVQNRLNPEGINCLRTFPGRGIRVWGARTINRDRNWRYLNVRRLFLLIHRWIERNMQWAAFEPNSFQLWIRIQRELSSYLLSLHQSGAFQGQIPEQAFYVKCDIETNPPEVREAGQVITEVGLAVNSPAEFIVMRIIQHAGTTDINV